MLGLNPKAESCCVTTIKVIYIRCVDKPFREADAKVGGYHGYESIRPSSLEYEMYFCQYLQHVDSFIYFSHKLVCCPPPTWTNTLHRNGVKAFGTFIIEAGTLGVERILEVENGKYWVAVQLARMANALGFDGWLLNFERSFSFFTEDPLERLLDFVQDLKSALGPEGDVIWYDALNDENKVDYQNTLGAHNVEFARAAGALFTNYKWTETELASAKVAAQWYRVNKEEVYFGIDMWAQNTNVKGPERITYPEQGGGGTLTGLVKLSLTENALTDGL